MFSFSAIAKNPPAIFIVAGTFIYVLGSTTNDASAMNMGFFCFIMGALLQVLYLRTRRGF